MNRYRQHAKALYIAVSVILLCIVCLTGATFALFTGNPNDGTIGVIATAGDIGVDVVDTSPEGVSLLDEVLEFQTSAERKTVLFEPGATFCTQGFKIKNTGNIHINFILSVSADESIDMDAFLDAFDIWIATDPQKPESAMPMIDFRGTLPAGKTSNETYYLFVKMKESAGDDFQGCVYDGIGITVHASQANVPAVKE